MDSIYNFLKNVWIDLIKETKGNWSFIFLLLLLITIPLSYAISNVFLILYIIAALINWNKRNFIFSKELVLPIIFFFIMCISYFWSIDKSLTLIAIPREITLLLIPLMFSIKSPKLKKEKLFKYYSFAMLGYVLYYLTRAIIRFILTNDTNVFFYHGDYDTDSGLVPKDLNAIHVSIFIGVGYFYFLKMETKTILIKGISALFFGFILLLSSKNIILVFFLLNLIYFFFYSKSANKMRLRNLIIVGLVIGAVFSFGKIKDRFLLEFQSNTPKSINSNVVNDIPDGVNNISIYEAWTNERFTPNDFFPGTAFRVYQARLFFEFLNEDTIFWKGFGLNASYKKLEEKGKKYNVFLGDNNNEGYQKKNFHNQYIQVFAELGIVGLMILITMLFLNTKNAFQSKDFMHIAFAILMISLFLTESFLWRQRGVVFFILFYCLFNFNKTVDNKNKI
ncbi:MAG: O-antigen ligase [Flavobacterium sp.]|jgi:O-antigen ligase